MSVWDIIIGTVVIVVVVVVAVLNLCSKEVAVVVVYSQNSTFHNIHMT